MENFKSFRKNNVLVEDQVARYIALTYLVSSQDVLTESSTTVFTEDINDILGKVGLSVHRGKGILDYIKSFSVGAGKVTLALLKGDKKKAKEIIQTLNKEDFINFLLKLDLGTLHILAEPLHLIDAWTGWELTANVKDKMASAKEAIQIFKDAVNKIKTNLEKVFVGKHLLRAKKAVRLLDIDIK